MWGFDTSRFLRSTEVHTLLDPSSYCCGFLRALAVQAAEPRAPVVKLWRLPRSWPSFGSIVRTGAPLTSITRVLQTSYMDKDSTMMCMQLWMHGCMDLLVCVYVCMCAGVYAFYVSAFDYKHFLHVSDPRFFFTSPTDFTPTLLVCFHDSDGFISNVSCLFPAHVSKTNPNDFKVWHGMQVRSTCSLFPAFRPQGSHTPAASCFFFLVPRRSLASLPLFHLTLATRSTQQVWPWPPDSARFHGGGGLEIGQATTNAPLPQVCQLRRLPGIPCRLHLARHCYWSFLSSAGAEVAHLWKCRM